MNGFFAERHVVVAFRILDESFPSFVHLLGVLVVHTPRSYVTFSWGDLVSMTSHITLVECGA